MKITITVEPYKPPRVEYDDMPSSFKPNNYGRIANAIKMLVEEMVGDSIDTVHTVHEKSQTS